MSGFSFADWPPVLTESQLEALTLYATTYALSHGLLYLPTTTPQPPAPTSAIHAPLSIFPSPLPRRLFDQARRLQGAYNVLYARIAMDEEFLDRVMGSIEGVGKVDDFVGNIWQGWKILRDEGLVQVSQIILIRLANSSTLVAFSTGSFSIRLSAACPFAGNAYFIETGRIQHHFIVFWSPFRAQYSAA